MAAQADRLNAMTSRAAIKLRVRNMSSLPSMKQSLLARSVAKDKLTVQEKFWPEVTEGIGYPEKHRIHQTFHLPGFQQATGEGSVPADPGWAGEKDGGRYRF